MLFAPYPETYRKDVSPRGMAGAVVFVAIGTAFALSPWGKQWVAADPGALVSGFFLYVSIYGLNVFLMKRGERLLEPRYWPLRALGCAAASMVGSLFAASSSFDASAAWVLHPMVALAIGIAVRPTRWMLLVFILPPLGLRLGFVPTASPVSFVVLFTTSVAAYGVFSRTAELLSDEESYGQQTEATAALNAEQAELSAELRASMSLHDGLSGSLLALRHKLRKGDISTGRTLVHAWLRRARQIVSSRAASAPLGPFLQQLAASLGVDLHLEIQQNEHSLESLERKDLLFIASEVIANTAAHSQSKSLSLVVVADSHRTSLLARMPHLELLSAPPPEQRGRGLRNIELRVLSRGGSLQHTPTGLRAEWPHGPVLERKLVRVGTELFFFVGVFASILCVLDGRLGPLIIVGLAVFFLLSAFWDRFQRVSTAKKRLANVQLERLVYEESAMLRLAESALDPELRNVEKALADGALPRVRTALDAVARSLQDLLWALEFAGDFQELQEDIADRAREVNASTPRVPVAATSDPFTRYQLIASLRHPPKASSGGHAPTR